MVEDVLIVTVDISTHIYFSCKQNEKERKMSDKKIHVEWVDRCVAHRIDKRRVYKAGCIITTIHCLSDIFLWYFFHSIITNTMSTNTQQATATTGSNVAHTAVAENVAVKSVVSTESRSTVTMENTQKMAALLGRLGKIHRMILFIDWWLIE